MTAGREPQHANLMEVDVPLRRVKAYQSQRPLRVLQRYR